MYKFLHYHHMRPTKVDPIYSYSFIEKSKIIPKTTALFLSYYYPAVNKLKSQVKNGVFIELDICQDTKTDPEKKYRDLSNLQSIYYFFRGLVASIIDVLEEVRFNISELPEESLLRNKFSQMTFFEKLSYRAASITGNYVKMGVQVERNEFVPVEKEYSELSNLQSIYYFFRGLVASIIDYPVHDALDKENPTNIIGELREESLPSNKFSQMTFFEKLSYRVKCFFNEGIRDLRDLQPLLPTYVSLLKNIGTLTDDQFDRLINQICLYDLSNEPYYNVNQHYDVGSSVSDTSWNIDIDYNNFKLERFNFIIEKCRDSRHYSLATEVILNISQSLALLNGLPRFFKFNQLCLHFDDEIIGYMAHVEDNNGISTDKKIEILRTIHQNSNSSDVLRWAIQSIERLEDKSHHSYVNQGPLENTLGRSLNYYGNDYRPAGSSNSSNYNRPGK